MNTFKDILICLFIIILTGCNILLDEDSSFSLLDSKIDFKIVESYDNNDGASIPQIFVDLKTEKIYGCADYSIVTNYKITDKSIIINIFGISKPELCRRALTPASGHIKLGKISGIFEVEIKNENFNDKYNLLITDSLVILDGKETAHTKPILHFLWRYPENSFVYLCGTTLSDTSICGSFIDTLESIINLTEFHFSDFAEIPYLKSSQGHPYDAPGRYFYYQSEADFKKIKEVMRSFRQNHFPMDNGVGLSIINWMNVGIYSWLL